MDLDQYNIYLRNYEKGIKKVSFRSSVLSIEKNTLSLDLKKSHGNYDLYFNYRGKLIKTDHFENSKKYKINYGYDHRGKLILFVKFHSYTNELLEMGEFVNDSKGRVKSEKYWIYYHHAKSTVTRKVIRVYNDRSEQVFSTGSEKDNEYMLFLSYDFSNRLIEEKMLGNEKETIFWNRLEYDENRNLIREVPLDDNGNSRGYAYEQFPKINGLVTGYFFNDGNKSCVIKYEYTYNEKGHWISQTFLHDGEPKYIYERELEYY